MDQVGSCKSTFGIHDDGVVEKHPILIALFDCSARRTTTVIYEIR